MADHNRKQERVIVGFSAAQLKQLDELATMVIPGVAKVSRSIAINMAIHEALERRKKSRKKSEAGA